MRLLTFLFIPTLIAIPAALPDSALVDSALPDSALPAWAWPVGGSHAIVQSYLAPATEYGPGHRGVDVAAMSPGIVTAPAAGVIHFAGIVVDRPVLSIDHGGGVLSSFEPVTTTLSAGDRVSAGQEIGTIESGHCPVLCVHLGARVDGSYVSPLLFLGGAVRSRLLPTRTIASGG